jgi:hypothetical protein
MKKDTIEGQPQQRLTLEDVQFLHHHIMALITFPNLPEELKDGILEGLNMLENSVNIYITNPQVIKNSLLAYATDGFQVEIEEPESTEEK